MTDPGVRDLPGTVRARVVAHVAAALPDASGLPPALRQIAGFAPARRAKVGGSTVVDALAGEGGEELRTRLAVHVGDRLVDAPADPDDAVERAARAWLLRPDGWAEQLAQALHELAESERRVDEGEHERLRSRLAAAERALQDAKDEHDAYAEKLRAENSKLRRRLGEARAAAREAGAGDDSARAEVQQAEDARVRAEEQAAGLDKELAAVRAEVARLESVVRAQRQSVRADKEEASLRARVLLETLIEAAGGLRRELALPPVTGAPADRLESEIAASDPGAGGAVRSAAQLEQYLAMPRARLIVDGYNVSKSLWPEVSLEAQRQRLLGSLAPLVARTGVETTVVFDAAATTARPVTAAPRGVKVLFSPPGVIADDVIVELAAVEPPGRVVLVVSDDAQVATDAARHGARPVAVRLLGERFERS